MVDKINHTKKKDSFLEKMWAEQDAEIAEEE